MLEISIAARDLFDERTQEFISFKGALIKLEHSLLSISKWEAKWHRPFLSDKIKMSEEELIDYIRCMTITQNVCPETYYALSNDNIEEIRRYIDNPMTATWFNDKDKAGNKRKTITSEIIYYWMVSLGIPFSCEKWHLNRLLTLIRVCNIESAPKKRMSKGDIYKQNSTINRARRQMMGSRG